MIDYEVESLAVRIEGTPTLSAIASDWSFPLTPGMQPSISSFGRVCIHRPYREQRVCCVAREDRYLDSLGRAIADDSAHWSGSTPHRIPLATRSVQVPDALSYHEAYGSRTG